MTELDIIPRRSRFISNTQSQSKDLILDAEAELQYAEKDMKFKEDEKNGRDTRVRRATQNSRMSPRRTDVYEGKKQVHSSPFDKSQGGSSFAEVPDEQRLSMNIPRQKQETRKN